MTSPPLDTGNYGLSSALDVDPGSILSVGIDSSKNGKLSFSHIYILINICLFVNFIVMGFFLSEDAVIVSLH
jgi:hypothetical protein